MAKQTLHMMDTTDLLEVEWKKNLLQARLRGWKLSQFGGGVPHLAGSGSLLLLSMLLIWSKPQKKSWQRVSWKGPLKQKIKGPPIMVDTATGEKKVFSGRVPLALLRRREQLVSEQITCQIEPYAMMALCWMPKDTLVGRRTVWWVDSEAARFSMIKGQSPSPVMRWLVR